MFGLQNNNNDSRAGASPRSEGRRCCLRVMSPHPRGSGCRCGLDFTAVLLLPPTPGTSREVFPEVFSASSAFALWPCLTCVTTTLPGRWWVAQKCPSNCVAPSLSPAMGKGQRQETRQRTAGACEVPPCACLLCCAVLPLAPGDLVVAVASGRAFGARAELLGAGS